MAGLRVLAVAQAFKETISATTVAAAFREAGESLDCDVRVLIGSDGGDGLLAALDGAFVRRSRHRVTGPLGSPVETEIGWLEGDVAIVESRLICGITLVPPGRRDPLRSTTRGVGELIEGLAGFGAREIVIGLGGSATVDGGTGMARALGWRFLDQRGADIEEGGGGLIDLERVVPGRRPVPVLGLADVLNPLAGPDGAIVYAPQKGAAGADLDRLSRGLDRLAMISGSAAARVSGAGAAGGLGFGILHFASGALTPGADWVLRRTGFDAALKDADVVITGEGAVDSTSLNGKLVGEVLARARDAGVQAVLVAPRVDIPTPHLTVETGGGLWDADALRRHARRGLARALRLPLD